MQDHDSLYHRLFSHPAMVTELLLGFIDPALLQGLDIAAMQRVNARLHAPRGTRRDGDVVWRIPVRTGGDAYLLLMLEFQSRTDRWMALRAMVYAGLLWQHAVRENRLMPDGRLPPVLPVVIYNGDPPWAAPLDLADLVSLPPGSPLWQWQPTARYRILDEGRFPEADLAERDNLAALLFRLEHARAMADVPPLVAEVIAWFRRHQGHDSLERLFGTLAKRVVEVALGPSVSVEIEENLQGINTMLATRAAGWFEQVKQDGLREGLQQGIREGRQAGQAAMLLRLAERRFGPLPADARARIEAAALPELEAWSLRILDAPDLDALLA
jgi:hypothetical protein